MGLAVRIIPTLLTRGRTLVKGVAFDAWRSVGLAQQAVRIHSLRGVDELVMLDIGATPEGRGPDLKLVEELAETCFMPLAVGGGIKSVSDVEQLLRAGADKVVICSALFADPDLLDRCAARFGAQAIVVAFDVSARHGYRMCSHGGKCRDTPPDIDDVAHQAYWAARRGAGEIMLTAVDREGAMQGYDLDLISAVSRAVDIPVIAHAGAGTYHHMLEAIQAGANAVAAGSMFQFTDQTPRGAAEYLQQHGIEVRT